MSQLGGYFAPQPSTRRRDHGQPPSAFASRPSHSSQATILLPRVSRDPAVRLMHHPARVPHLRQRRQKRQSPCAPMERCEKSHITANYTHRSLAESRTRLPIPISMYTWIGPPPKA
ncbi:hypothetical protein FIBSPDRAFT_102038 [Athelia psychrophila]|uniref:Uncharacterized protein n=1 Tax=Athelia psychrophila TaxID=1759441 RepID=A0A166DHN8_9AGAM|nr:hypothetical protein FIBSPDRAFT_102038 [Fibularhizoctonia sp. CBS 109695]